MKVYFLIWVFAILFILFACNNHKEKPAFIIHDSLNVQNTIDIEAATVKSDDYYDNFQNSLGTLKGCRTAIRQGDITIAFSNDSTFEFNDCNTKLKERELLTGRFELNENALTLFYNDRPKQKFNFERDSHSNDEYRIKNSTG